MKKCPQFIILLLFTSILSSCGTTVNINDYIDTNVPLTLIVWKRNITTGQSTSDSFTIAVNSVKYKKIIQWSKENTSDWKLTPASYNTEIVLTQNNFRLLYTTKTDGVVIGFKDKTNKERQYSKKIKKSELDFIIE